MLITWRKLKYRFRTPQKKKNKAASHRGFALIIIPAFFCTAAFFAFCKAEDRIGPLVQQSAISKLNSVVTKSVNKSVQDVIESENIDTQNLIIPQKDDNGKIISMSADYNTVNRLKSALAINIQEQIDNLDIIETNIPIGLLFSDTIMTGAGFRIKLKIFAINSISVEFRNEFYSAGINQTKYKLSAEVKIPLHIAGIACREDTEIITQIPIAETVIIGDIPQTYLDVQR